MRVDKETPILTYKGLEWRLVTMHAMGDYFQCGDYLITVGRPSLREALDKGTHVVTNPTPEKRREIIARGAGGLGRELATIRSCVNQVEERSMCDCCGSEMVSTCSVCDNDE